jgi:hypothetical protein
MNKTRTRWTWLAVPLAACAGMAALAANPVQASPGHPDRPAVVRAANGHLTWLIRTAAGGGDAQVTFNYGVAGDIPVWADWDNNGTRTPGVFRNGRWLLKNSLGSGNAEVEVAFGRAGDIPVVGNWDGAGGSGIGVVRDNVWYLRQTVSTGIHDVAFSYGTASDVPVVGDWDNNNSDTPGVFRNGVWLLKNSLGSGNADRQISYGTAGDVPMTGDWAGTGDTGIGVRRGATWLLRNDVQTGNATTQFAYGVPTDRPLYTSIRPDTSAPLRGRIAAIAEDEIGVTGDGGQCQKYGPCGAWCAMFARWVWDHAGVNDLFATNTARAVGLWGQQRGLFYARGSATPQVGDIAVYGPPADQTGGHVSIVVAVHSDGTITTVNGNYDNRVAATRINPNTHRSGEDEWLISGYVRPPGA